MVRPLKQRQIDDLEHVVKNLLLKGNRKQIPFTKKSLDKAVANGVGLINHIFGTCYPDEQPPLVVPEYRHYYQKDQRAENDRYR